MSFSVRRMFVRQKHYRGKCYYYIKLGKAYPSSFSFRIAVDPQFVIKKLYDDGYRVSKNSIKFPVYDARLKLTPRNTLQILPGQRSVHLIQLPYRFRNALSVQVLNDLIYYRFFDDYIVYRDRRYLTKMMIAMIKPDTEIELLITTSGRNEGPLRRFKVTIDDYANEKVEELTKRT